MKSPAAHSYVTSRSHLTTCFESTIVSLLLLSKKASLAIATIPSPKHNTASEKQDSGLLQAERREGVRRRLSQKQNQSRTEVGYLSSPLPHLLENRLESICKTNSIFKVKLQNFAADLDTERSEKLQQVLTSSNKESSITVFVCFQQYSFASSLRNTVI